MRTTKELFSVEWDADNAFGDTFKETLEDLYMVIVKVTNSLSTTINPETLVGHPTIAELFTSCGGGAWPWNFPWWKEGRHYLENINMRWRLYYDTNYPTDILTVGDNESHATIKLVNFKQPYEKRNQEKGPEGLCEVK